MTKEEKTTMARAFFRQAILFLEDVYDDEIYSEIDPDDEFGDELPNVVNLDTVKEALRIGFTAKYGTSLGM